MDTQNKILLIDPPGSVVGINSGLGYLAGSLIAKGIDVKILDFNNNQENQKDRLYNELKNGYKTVGFSVKVNTILSAIKIAQWCKEFSKDIILVVGGPGVTVVGQQFLDGYKIFDYAFIGETEDSITDFMPYIYEGNKYIKDIKGLCYRQDEKNISNPVDIPLTLDTIPFPDYSVFDIFDGSKNVYPLVTSRGCPYDCSYCSVKIISGKRFRTRSPENVIEELKQAKKRYGVNRFEILDDTFTQDIKRAKKICELIIKEKINMTWVCQNGIRADRVDKELLNLMKDAGCTDIWLGIESLDKEIFDRIKKGEGIEDILNAVRMAQDTGIEVSAFFIIGLPGSTYARDMETLNKTKKLGLKMTTWSIATPYPHTALWDWVQKNGRILRDYRDVSFFVEPKCVFATNDYTEKERLAVYYKANLAFSRYECLTAEKSWPNRISSILKVIVKYDAYNLPRHLIAGSWMLAKRAFA